MIAEYPNLKKTVHRQFALLFLFFESFTLQFPQKYAYIKIVVARTVVKLNFFKNFVLLVFRSPVVRFG